MPLCVHYFMFYWARPSKAHFQVHGAGMRSAYLVMEESVEDKDEESL